MSWTHNEKAKQTSSQKEVKNGNVLKWRELSRSVRLITLAEREKKKIKFLFETQILNLTTSYCVHA